MKCPKCGGEKNRVIDTRRYDTVILRERVCLECATVYKTAETIDEKVEK